MADESMQSDPAESGEDVIGPDDQVPVRLDSLEADGTRPSVGDEVTIKIVGSVKKIENDYAFVTPEQINDTDINEILADTGEADEDSMMQRLTSQADQAGTPIGGGGPY